MKTMRKRLSLFIAFAMFVSLQSIAPTVIPAAAEPDSVFIISNPYAHVDWETFKQYKYANHVHTSNSDGNSSTRTMAEEHYKMGYHIVALTDHDFTHVTPSQVRTATPLSIRRVAEMQANGGTGSELRSGSDGMIFVPYTNERSGLSFAEIDPIGANPSDPPSHHVNTYWSNIKSSSSSIASMVERLSEEGTGFAMINHPGRNTGSQFETSWSTAERIANNPKIYTPYADIFNKYPYILGMEIINKFDTETQAERILWDNILGLTIPQGRTVWGFSGDDAHHTRAIGFSYNLMLMPELSLSELKYSMDTGAFFAFSRVDRQYKIHPKPIETWHWSGQDMGSSDALKIHTYPVPEINSITVNGDVITIDASGHEFINWYADGVMIHQGATLDLSLFESSVKNYVRATVGHKDRGVLYTQPFGVQKAGAEREKPILQSVTQPKNITVQWGYASEMSFGLPSNVPIKVSTGETRPATVIWDLKNTGFNPAVRDKDQTFTVTGTVRLNGIANPNNVSLNVSVKVTMLAVICMDCAPLQVLVWAPDLNGKTVEGNNIGGDLGIQLGDPPNSSAAIIGNSIHLTATEGTYKPMRILTSGNIAGWNPNTGFAAVEGAEYLADFMLSVSSGTGDARIQNRVTGEDARISVNADNLTTTPKNTTHQWTQVGTESFNIDTRNTKGAALVIGDIKIYKLYRCNGNCSEPDRFTRCGCVKCADGIVTPPVTTPPVTTTTPPSTTITGTSSNGTTGTSSNGTTETSSNGTTGTSSNGTTGTSSNGTTGTSSNGTTGTSSPTTTITTNSEETTTNSEETTTNSGETTTNSDETTTNSDETTTNSDETTTNSEETTTNSAETITNSETGTNETTTGTSSPATTTNGTTGSSSPTTTTGRTTTAATEPSSTTTNQTRHSGDVNGDKKITIADALEILKYLAGIKNIIDADPAAFDAARVTGGEKPTVGDALEILKYLAKMKSLVTDIHE